MITGFKKKKLLIIGPFPPPYGGVSIHIERLITMLNTNFEIIKIDEASQKKATIFNLRSLHFFKYFGLVAKSNIIHIHSGHYLLRFFHFCTSKVFHKKLIITIHAYEERDKTFVEKYIDRFIFKYTNRVIFVSEEISQKFALQNSIIKPAFLPPNLCEEAQLPLNMLYWIKCKKDDGYLICCANASRLDISNNQDLYGLDLCIEAAKKCREENMKIAFVFVVSDSSGGLNINFYESLINQYDLANLFFLHKSSISFISLIEQADIILRPTNTDGDALTVREGLFLDKKVIASDVAKRPVGTYTFKNRDIFSLMYVIKEVRKDLKNNIGRLKTAPDIKPLNAAYYKDFYITNIYN
jgi:glycosyltransferase involved in cell wall biosynthesis